MRRLSLAMTALLLASCVSTTSVVRSRFARDQGCPEDQVTVDEASATEYRARGCEKETTFVCSAPSAFRGGVQCVEQGLPAPPGYREAEHPVMAAPDPRVPAPH
jgi:hypothetical protein